MEKTCATRCASSTVWYPDPVPISRHVLLAGELEQLEVPRVDQRLGDGLAAADRQRCVFVRAMAQRPSARRRVAASSRSRAARRGRESPFAAGSRRVARVRRGTPLQVSPPRLSPLEYIMMRQIELERGD